MYKTWFRLILFGYLLFMYFLAPFFPFMALNVLLAWIPLEIAWFAEKRVDSLLGKISLLFWLLFYPNIPYLLTDLFHLETLSIYSENAIFHNDITSWFSFLLLIVPILFLPAFGVRSAEHLLAKFFPKQSRLVLVAVFVLAALGIYAGRFLRLHSVHFLIAPLQTLTLIFGLWNWDKLAFILIFTIIQLLLWQVPSWLKKVAA